MNFSSFENKKSFVSGLGGRGVLDEEDSGHITNGLNPDLAILRREGCYLQNKRENPLSQLKYEELTKHLTLLTPKLRLL